MNFPRYLTILEFKPRPGCTAPVLINHQAVMYFGELVAATETQGLQD